MTFGEFIENVVLDLDEDMDDVEVVEMIKRYINRGYKELAKKEGLEKTKTVTILDGKVSKPLDMYKLYHVLNGYSNINFNIRGNYIYIDDVDTADLVYSYIPENMESYDDTPYTNPMNDEYIINFAKWQYSLYDDEIERASYFKNLLDYQNISFQSNIVKIVDVMGVM